MDRISHGEKFVKALLQTVLFPLTLFQTTREKIELRRHRPTGRLVPIDQRALHAIVSGEGSPVIVLESGMGGGALDWSLVQPQLSKLGTVVSYDRAGFGWSFEHGLKQPTCSQYVEDLSRLLKELGLKPPYILVGHSYGGLMTRLFASRYADEVSGLVLVDAVHESKYISEDRSDSRKKQRNDYVRQLRLGYLLSPIAIPRLLNMHIGSKRLPEATHRAVRALGFRAGAYRAAYAEVLATEGSARELSESNPLIQDLPVIVLSAGR